MKWSGVGTAPTILKPALDNDISELMRVIQIEGKGGGTGGEYLTYPDNCI